MCFADSGKNQKEQMGYRPQVHLLYLHQNKKIKKINHDFHLWRCYKYVPIYLILH